MLYEKRLKSKFNINTIFMYVLLIPFLYPRGFTEFSGIYKKFFTVWLYGTILLIFCIFIFSLRVQHLRYKNCIYWMMVLYFYFIFDTLMIQGGIGEGLQKLFAVPALCLLCGMILPKWTGEFLNCIANILIFNFALNIIVFNPWLSSQFSITGNIIFIGHVQVAAQLGIIGVLVSYLIREIYPEKKYKSIGLFVLSILTMIVSKTSASFLCLLILFCGILYLYFSKTQKLFKWDSRIYIIIVLFINALLFLYLVKNRWSLSIFGKDITFNGRLTIWKEIFEMLQSHFLFGYGVYGAHIKVYWSSWVGNPEGMTYAHNQFLQMMLDGGVILLILFIIMLLSYVANVKKVKNSSVKALTNVCLLAISFIMLPDTVTEYYYIYLFLSILAYLPEIISMEWKRNIPNNSILIQKE